jgi:hypothetical protein
VENCISGWHSRETRDRPPRWKLSNTRGNSLGKKIKIGKRIKSKVAKASFCCMHQIMYSNGPIGQFENAKIKD